MVKYKISVIGAGAVGTRLGIALTNAGHQIVQVISQQYESAKSLAGLFDASYSTRIDELDQEAELVFLTVPDSVLPQIIKSLNKKDAILIHTSGSFPMLELRSASDEFGVVYPLQSFSRDREVEFKRIPLFIEASNEKVLMKLMDLAQQLSSNVQMLPTSKRQALHVAAVFASNFVSFLIGRAEHLTDVAGVSRDLFAPLIYETVEKSILSGANDAITGPARRGDMETIKKHLDLLSCCPREKEVYLTLTKAILAQYGFEY